jgi:hypothetical protein
MASLLNKKLLCLSTLAKYTDRATAACHLSCCQSLRIEGMLWLAQRIPTAAFSVARPDTLIFLSSIVLTRLSGPRSRPTTSQKMW